MELSCEENKKVMESLTVRNLSSDYLVVLELLRGKVAPKDLKASLGFILSRGNQANDVRVVLALIESGIKSEHLYYCFKFLEKQGKVPGDVQLLVDFGKSCKEQAR
jgi:hypothetical protein